MNTSLRLSIIAALVLAASAGLVHGDDFTYTTNNGTITITGYIGQGGAVTIPSEIVSGRIKLTRPRSLQTDPALAVELLMSVESFFKF